MIITDEMVEKAFRIYWGTPTNSPETDLDAMRAALEAVAPMLIAQYLRAKADDVNAVGWMEKLFLSLAQELDPK